MSKRYKGAILSSTPPTTSASSASGVWTEQQFMQGVATGSWPALPGAPTIGTATAGALNASVTFTAPTYTGSGITGYTVTSSPGGITGTGASSPITVSGLTAGTPYTFTVTATTAAGQGPASAASNSVTPTAPNYIEDVYSTYLYTGNNATQTITNGINLSGKGGLIWGKARSSSAFYPYLSDTVRGLNNQLYSNTTDAQNNVGAYLTATSTGYTINNGGGTWNNGGTTYVNWTFAEQAKFFDVVTYTGNGVAGRTVAHNLGSTPGCIIVKCTSTSGNNWAVYHRDLGGTKFLLLNSTQVAIANSSLWNNTDPTSTDFTVGSGTNTNGNGDTYVAYLFAHNAGGFGLTGTDNVISCGSFTAGSNSAAGSATINLGYEPQWILTKNATGTSTVSWQIYDNMRGCTAANPPSYPTSNALNPNNSNTESDSGQYSFNSTGFVSHGGYTSGDTIIYIAIRRGPMAVPTLGTSVFYPQTRTANGVITSITGIGFPPDMVWSQRQDASGNSPSSIDKLRGPKQVLLQNSSGAEATSGATYDVSSFDQDGVTVQAQGQFSVINYLTAQDANWYFKRAPGFFDEVCYIGNNATDRTITHNLGVVPEMMIVKARTNTGFSPGNDWNVVNFGIKGTYYSEGILNSTTSMDTTGVRLNLTVAPTSTTVAITGSDFSYGNYSPNTYVCYLFATVAGVSKVGTYTGTGTLTTINCGFSGGARFVMIKRINASSAWYVWDTARGMVSGTDPSLALNSTAAESNANSVYTATTGFQLLASPSADVNTNGGTYFYLAIA